MRADLQSLLRQAQESLARLHAALGVNSLEERCRELDGALEDPSVWSTPSKARQLTQERARLTTALSQYNHLKSTLHDHIDLVDLADSEGEQGIMDESQEALSSLLEAMETAYLGSLLSDEADVANCFLEIHAGAGGTESQDWAAMLARMYTRWGLAHQHTVSVLEENAGDEAGFKSMTLKVTGHQAYGWLKTETGVHRLVRISPFDSQSRRHTSFASVTVFPEIDDTIDVNLQDKDIRVDTYRASGAGGQHINKTDSAVRMTHLPTGLVVQCQSERSQHKNRAIALKMLEAKLYAAERQKRETEAQKEYEERGDMGWGYQIRSYVMNPYQMVKDARTGLEKGDVQRVLDGDIDPYLSAALAHRARQQHEEAPSA